MSLDIAKLFNIGARFNSFAEVEQAIELLSANSLTTFWKRDARTIANCKVVRPIESSLVYYQLVYACNHGGKKFKSKGKNIRRCSTYKENCPVHVRFKASADGTALEVTSFQDQHNHETLVNARHKIATNIETSKYESAENGHVNNFSMSMSAIEKKIIPNEEETTNVTQQSIKQEIEYLPESLASPDHPLEPICLVSTTDSINHCCEHTSALMDAEKTPQEDQHDIFAKFVASELRCVKSENLQKKMKLMIVKILMETTE